METGITGYLAVYFCFHWRNIYEIMCKSKLIKLWLHATLSLMGLITVIIFILNENQLQVKYMNLKLSALEKAMTVYAMGNRNSGVKCKLNKPPFLYHFLNILMSFI